MSGRAIATDKAHQQGKDVHGPKTIGKEPSSRHSRSGDVGKNIEKKASKFEFSTVDVSEVDSCVTAKRPHCPTGQTSNCKCRRGLWLLCKALMAAQSFHPEMFERPESLLQSSGELAILSRIASLFYRVSLYQSNGLRRAAWVTQKRCVQRSYEHTTGAGGRPTSAKYSVDAPQPATVTKLFRHS